MVVLEDGGSLTRGVMVFLVFVYLCKYYNVCSIAHLFIIIVRHSLIIILAHYQRSGSPLCSASKLSGGN